MSRQVAKIETDLNLGDEHTADRKITEPVQSIDLSIRWDYTTGGAPMTLTNLALAIGALALIKLLKLETASGYSESFSKEEILAMAILGGVAPQIQSIDNVAGTPQQAYLNVRIPTSLVKGDDTLTTTFLLSNDADIFSANAPAVSNVKVEISFNYGTVGARTRTMKKPLSAVFDQEIEALPTTGTLTDIVLIRDLDDPTQGDDVWLNWLDNAELKQDDKQVTNPSASQLLNNFYELVRTDRMEVHPGIGYIPVDQLKLTDNEKLQLVQDNPATGDVIFVYLKDLPRQTEGKFFIQAPIDLSTRQFNERIVAGSGVVRADGTTGATAGENILERAGQTIREGIDRITG